MKAPVCRTCGKEHWGRVCDGAGSASIGRRYSKAEVEREMGAKAPRQAPKLVTSVTKPATVTKAVVTNRELEDENERLRDEVAMLKRKLAERSGGRPPVGEKAMTAAERKRRSRAAHQLKG